MWPGAPRSMPDGSFLARASSALLLRPHVASWSSILCSANCSANSPPGVCRRHDRFEPPPFSRSRRRKGRGEARGAGAGHSRRGCMPTSPVVGVRRQPPARVPFDSAGRADDSAPPAVGPWCRRKLVSATVATKINCDLLTQTPSQPRLGLVARCGDLAL